jgi:hypothetical protein
VPSNEHDNQSARTSKSFGKLLTNPGRRKQLAHIFSALFYDSHVRPLVNYTMYLDSLAPGAEPMSKFAYRNSCIREAWENAPSDIQQHVMEYKGLSEMSLEELEEMDGDDDKENGKRSASTRSNGIVHSREYIAAGDKLSATGPGMSSMKDAVTSPTIQGYASNEDHTPGGTTSQGTVGSASEAGAPAKETVLGGEEAVGGDEISCNKGTAEEEPGNDIKKLNVLTKGNQAASMFKSAIRETIQMKKTASREKCVFFLRICYHFSLKLL